MPLLDTPTLQAPTYTPPSYTPAQATAQQATSQGYTPETFSVTPEQTQESRIANIISTDSPLMQQAATRAKQAANARGLLNSTMAVQAGHEAVIGAAAPIAQYDAGVFERAGTNSVNAKNAALNFAAQAANQAELANAQLGTQASMSNADARNKAFSEAYQTAMQGSLANLDASTRTGIANLDATTRMDLGNLDANTRLSLGTQDAQTRLALGQLDASTRMGTAQLDAQTRLALGELDANSRQQISTMENQYRQLLQTNSNAASSFSQISTNIANLQNNKELSVSAREKAIQTQLNMMNELLQQQQAVTTTEAAAIQSLDLGSFYGGGSAASTSGSGGAGVTSFSALPLNGSIPAGGYRDAQGNVYTASGALASWRGPAGQPTLAPGQTPAQTPANPTPTPKIGDTRLSASGTYTERWDGVAWRPYNISTRSDRRDKTNFAPVEHGLDFINALKPTAYQYRQSRETEIPEGPTQYGFIAQEVLALEGETPVIIDNRDPEYLLYNDSSLLTVLVQAVQELSAEVKALKAEKVREASVVSA